MYLDVEDNRPEPERLGGAITGREAVLLSIIFHMCLILLALVMPDLPTHPEVLAARAERAEQMAREHERNSQRFVFVAPRRDIQAPKPPPTPDLSDKDRLAQAPRRAERPENPLPYARGNSPERVESPPGPPAPEPPQPTDREQGGRDDRVAQAQKEDAGSASQPGSNALALPGRASSPPAAQPGQGRNPIGLRNSIAEALRNIQRYSGGESFDNPQGGGGAYGPSIQFDTKGVEFGPWIRRFVAQIKRNWFIPYAAMAMHGHVVLTFNVYKDGRISDLTVVAPSSVDAFNNAAFNALTMSSPTYPLPAEYPADHAFFTVTFYYNESERY